MSGTGAQAGSQATKRVNVAAHKGRDPDAIIGGLVLGDLERAEQTGRTGDGRGDKPEAPKDAAPLLGADAAQVSQLGEDGMEGLLPVGWELDSLPGGVDDPPEDEFSGAPAAIAAEEFLQGDGFISGVPGLRLGQHRVDTVEQVAAQCPEAPAAALAKLDKIVNEHIGCPNRMGKGLIGGWSPLLEAQGCRSLTVRERIQGQER